MMVTPSQPSKFGALRLTASDGQPATWQREALQPELSPTELHPGPLLLRLGA